VLKKHCEDVDRDYEMINRTVTALAVIADTDEQARDLIPPNLGFAYPGDVASYGLIGTVQTIEKRIAAFEAAGVQELIVNFGDPTSVDQVAHFAELFLSATPDVHRRSAHRAPSQPR
jgi:alkanesulfonate monooxygenase SsuD/methylene tetrahydromethanopterin reductase-like flavin-dependent oxidoreductase (luciferase family)